MSGTSGTTPPSGLVRNSALSFVAPAQAPLGLPENTPALSANAEPKDEMGNSERPVPAGLKALCEAYSALYPDQPNPLQVTTRLKYWLGGQDPLDYISMYWNPGKPEEHIPPHWHYVSFGLSDLHGDGRVHPPPAVGAKESGYGLELTLRLAEDRPAPLWPAALLQALARYVFTTGNKFCAGDHVSWHAPLDGDSTSRVRHLLVADDPQLGPIDSPHGQVKFIQMVGCTGRELKAAQRGSGFEVLKLIADDPRCGGPWLVTRARRRRSVPRVLSAPSAPLSEASPLAGVNARLAWLPYDPHEPHFSPHSPHSPLSPGPSVEQQIKDTLQRGLSCMTPPEGHRMATDSFEMSSLERALPQLPEPMQGSWRGDESVEYLDGVHLVLNPEGASLLPLAIEGRVARGGHFTWRCGPLAATLLGTQVAGALPSGRRPYARTGLWLQMLIPPELAREMAPAVGALAALGGGDSESEGEASPSPAPAPSPAPRLPLALHWPRHRLRISVLPDHHL